VIAHVCQDEYGFWFFVEESGGELTLHSHAGTKEDMLEEAERTWATEVLVEDGELPYPEGGLAPGYEPPEPRKVR
jgi:hypothetical protein